MEPGRGGAAAWLAAWPAPGRAAGTPECCPTCVAGRHRQEEQVAVRQRVVESPPRLQTKRKLCRGAQLLSCKVWACCRLIASPLLTPCMQRAGARRHAALPVAGPRWCTGALPTHTPWLQGRGRRASGFVRNQHSGAAGAPPSAPAAQPAAPAEERERPHCGASAGFAWSKVKRTHVQLVRHHGGVDCGEVEVQVAAQGLHPGRGNGFHAGVKTQGVERQVAAKGLGGQWGGRGQQTRHFVMAFS